MVDVLRDGTLLLQPGLHLFPTHLRDPGARALVQRIRTPIFATRSAVSG